MKNPRLFLALSLITGALAGLSSCGQNTHVHSKAEAYSYDDDGHYHACASCDENVRFDYEGHIYNETNPDTCIVCGFTKKDALKEGFNLFKAAYTDYVTDKSSTFEVTNEENNYSMGKLARSKKNAYKMTIDVDQAAFAQVGTEADSSYNSNNEWVTSTEANSYAYIKDSEGNIFYYENEDEEKDFYKSDKKLFDRFYKEDYLIEFQYVDEVLSSADFTAFKARYERSLLLSSVAVLGTTYSSHSENGILEFSIESATCHTSDTTKTVITVGWNFSMDIASERFVSMEQKVIYDVTSPKEVMARMEQIDKIKYSGDFDKTFYDSFDKTGFEDAGYGEFFQIPVYYGDDYDLGYSIYADCGSPLSGNTYSNWGVYYYDKELTKPYNNEPISGDIERLYVKANIPEDRSLAIVLTETTYVDPFGIIDDYVEKTISGTQYSVISESSEVYYYLSYKTDMYSGKIGTMYLDGVELTDTKILQEGGKVYNIVYKLTCFDQGDD